MIEFLSFVLGAGCATAACWWFWKSSDAERKHLREQIDQLQAKIKDKMS